MDGSRLTVRLDWQDGPPAPCAERRDYEQRAVAAFLLVHIATYRPGAAPGEVAAEAARVLLDLSAELGRQGPPQLVPLTAPVRH